MPDFIAGLRTEFATLKGEYENLLKETEKREYTADEKKGQETRFARMEAIKAQLEERAKFAKLAADEGKVALPVQPEGKDEFDASKVDIKVMDPKKIDRSEFNKNASQWALTGDIGRQFATITTATSSGILLPTGVAAPQINPEGNVYREAFALYGLTPISTATTEVINYPIMNIGQGQKPAENATSQTDNAPDFNDSVVLTPAMFTSGLAPVSDLVLGSNGGFDLLTFIEQELELAKELKLENDITADLVADSDITQEVNISTGANDLYGSLTQLNNKLPRRFNRLKVMVMDKTAYTEIEGLRDDNGQPVMLRDPQNQNLVRFNGTPVLWTEGFGDYSGSDGTVVGVILSLLGFKLRDVTRRQVERDRDVKNYPAQTLLALSQPHAYGWAPNAVAKLKR